MLFWIYIVIAFILVIVTLKEMFEEKDWKNQIAFAMLLIPFVLRILQIK